MSVLNHDLPFLGMAFFLAGIEPTLFFWGRSMRCSLASTTITVRSKEPLCNTFLPGRFTRQVKPLVAQKRVFDLLDGAAHGRFTHAKAAGGRPLGS